jgi:hypothetical protein
MRELKTTQVADLSSVAASTTVDFDSQFVKVKAVQAVWTSTTASFALTLQFSVDGSNWTDFTTATSITNTSSHVYWNVADTVDVPYWRVNVARTSGTLTTLKVYTARQTRS